MPEGPEIHRAANRIAKALVGKTLSEVEFHYKTVEGSEPVSYTHLTLPTILLV